MVSPAYGPGRRNERSPHSTSGFLFDRWRSYRPIRSRVYYSISQSAPARDPERCKYIGISHNAVGCGYRDLSAALKVSYSSLTTKLCRILSRYSCAHHHHQIRFSLPLTTLLFTALDSFLPSPGTLKYKLGVCPSSTRWLKYPLCASSR